MRRAPGRAWSIEIAAALGAVLFTARITAGPRPTAPDGTHARGVPGPQAPHPPRTFAAGLSPC